MNWKISVGMAAEVLSLALVGLYAQVTGKSTERTNAPDSSYYYRSTLEEMERLEKEKVIETVAGASVYKLPLISRVNVRSLQLFPHYKPKRAAAGWTHAYLEFATPIAGRIWVEEIPPRSLKLIGRQDMGTYLFLGVSGKGYAEFREDPQKPGTGVIWNPGSLFYMPFGSWYGLANPFDQPARILICAKHLSEDTYNPFLLRIRTVPEQTFPGERRDPVLEDTVIENVNWPTAIAQAEKRADAAKTLDMERRGPAATLVINNGLGDSLNPGNMEMPSHHKTLRAKTGWKGLHIQPAFGMGWRAGVNNLQEIPPRSQEIGHKHAGGLVFVCVKGRGYTALRATSDSTESRVYWEEFDLWQLPYLSPAGVWHSHANPYNDQPARFMGFSGGGGGDNLLNANIDRAVGFASDGVGFGNPDKIFKEKTDAPE